MQFGITWVALALVVGYALGFAIAFAADRAMMKKWRGDSLFAQMCVETLTKSCRNVLADSWFNKVMRAYKAELERRCAHA